MEWLRGLWNGTTKPPMLRGAEVGEMIRTQCSEGWMRSEARTASPETEWEKWMNLPQAHDNKTRTIFSYCNRWKGGGEFVGLSGSGAGQKRWFCAAIIHNGVIGFFIGFIPSWKLKKTINYMLCIHSFELFFFWRKCSTVVAVGVQTSFLLFAKSVTEKNNSRVDCAEADKKTVQAQRYEGRGFLAAGDFALGAARN